MAAILSSIHKVELIGTHQDRVVFDTTALGAGSLFFETDTKKSYLWDGATWQSLTL